MSSPVFLVGFMAAGKTSVGRALAAASGRRFVDLDDVIAAGLAGGDTVAQLVARDEPELRRRETAALADTIAASSDGPIVATGGGAAVHGDNLDRMRAAGLVVALGVDVDDALARSARPGNTPRPLLANAAALAATRAPAYRRATALVDTTTRAIDRVVAGVQAVERVWLAVPPARRATTTILELGARSYPIVVVDDPVAPFDGALVRAQLPGVTRVAVITDRDVAVRWLATATAALAAAGFDLVDTIELAPGEASKSIAVYHDACARLVARGLDRSSAIIALGGGVVGDLAGFVAATLFRGIPVVQLPTTLVAMTDAAIGGKTAIDLPAGKNLIGAFWQPRLVACGLATLATLPVRERRAGFGELWKYALLDGAALWTAVDGCAPWAATSSIGAAPPAELRDVIVRAIAYKAAIVSRDERELTGQRALLNLGHTVGHAIESEAGGALQHGEAVGLGLIAACRVSAALGLASPALALAVTEALRHTGLPTDLEPWLTDAVLARISVDKKRAGTTIKFIAVREVGACEPVDIAVTDIGRILRPVHAP